MWNYSFMLPSIMVLVTLLIFYFVRRRLPIRMNRTFLTMLFTELLIMAADIISSRLDENYQLYIPALLYLANTLFFVLFIQRTYLFFHFSVDVLRLETWKNPALKWAFRVPLVVGEALAVTSFATGAVFRIDGTGYHSGPCYNVLYVCFFFYIISSVALIVVYRRRLSVHQFASGIVYNAVLFVGNIARILFPWLLIMHTFCVIAVLIIYLAYENPDLYLSDRGASFNMRGFKALLWELSNHRSYSMLGFALQNYNHERSILGGGQMDEAIGLISLFLLKTYPNYLAFYLRGGRYVLFGPASVEWTRVRDAISERFQQPWQASNGTIYLNVGFAFLSSGAKLDSADRIINNMAIALTAAGQPDKPTSPDGVINVESAQQLDQQIDISRTIEHALDNDQVEVFLQPVYDSHSHRIVAAEALARLRDADGNIVAPAMFIPVAEKSGYIGRLGEMVFEKTCAFIHDQDMEALGLMWINVNLSPIQCMQRNLADRFDEILKRYDVPADLLHLEITEQSIIDYTLLEKQIIALRSAGFQFVLDDFGSGYSNLTRVKHYPFINIKLDMDVVWDYFRERDNLLPTIVQGFKDTGLSITAEGIETMEMAEVLTGIGCDYLQGFLFDKPLDMDTFVKKYSRG